jgi:hypothetical protein
MSDESVKILMRVLPNWRVCHKAKLYEAGDTVEMEMLQAAEMSAWGSVEKATKGPITAEQQMELIHQVRRAHFG